MALARACGDHFAQRFVPREEVNGILGYQLNYHFRGFGSYGSGLRQITESEYEQFGTFFIIKGLIAVYKSRQAS